MEQCFNRLFRWTITGGSLFQDTKLDSLIALAVDRNYSVAMAINRIAAARANLWAERGNFFPSIGLNAGWTRQETSGNTSSLPQSTEHYYDAAVSMSWESMSSAVSASG